MPTYEYECSECEQTQEVYHRMAEQPQVRCQRGHPMRRILSSFHTHRDKLYEFTHEHLPGKPSFRTKGQWETYKKRNHLTETTARELKLNAGRRGGRNPPKHDMKAWWRKEAEKYRGLVNQPGVKLS